MALKLGSSDIIKLYLGSSEVTRAYLGANLVYGSAWTPAEITTSLWLDAADSSTIIQSGGLVSQWNDKSGNGRNAAQATGSRQPATGATLNNINVVSFAGDYMGFTGTHDATWSTVSVVSFMGANQGIYQYGGVNTDGSLFRENTDLTIRTRPATDSDFNAPETNVATILSAEYSTTNLIYKNGVAGVPSAAVTPILSINSASTLGGLSSTVFILSGYIAETIHYNGKDTATRQKIEGYLAWKWGLEGNLPTDHPYKNSAP